MAMKTPGVYIVEKNAFPNSVVEVATAVPAFIGYTKTANNGGNDLTGKPWRIASMAEYERYFGGPPEPTFKVHVVDKDAANKVAAATAALTPADADAATKATAATNAKTAVDTSPEGTAVATEEAALQALLANPSSTAAAKETAQAKVEAAHKALAALPAVKTHIDAKLASDKAAAVAQAARMDLALANAALAAAPAGPDMAKPRGQQVQIKRKGKTYLLTRQSGKDGRRFLMHQAMRHFFQNGGGPCYVVSVGDHNTDISAGDDTKGLIGGLAPLLKEQEPTMVLTPDAVLLPKADCVSVQTAVLKHCGLDMRSRVAILDVWGGELDRQDPAGSCIDDFRNDIGINFLDFATAYYPWLHTSLQQAGDFRYGMIENPDDLQAMIWDELGLGDAELGDKKAAQQRAALDDLALPDEAPAATPTAPSWVGKLTAIINASNKSAEQKAAAIKRLADEALRKDDLTPHKMLLDKTLLSMSELYTKLRDEALGLLNLMPPSAAMAGLYTMVDNTRGVWKAPANVSVAGVIKPAVEISHADQEDLNVSTQGKSINAIRSFIGEGALVWGARTLDGNSLDWRYISVRRTMIMLEESCRLAAKAMVFEPNVGNTWVTIKSMISNFLIGIWKRGGLAGAVPDDAFSVHVGLGETMTPEDILEGILRVTVLVAISRPAEFIEITFQQQMQKS